MSKPNSALAWFRLSCTPGLGSKRLHAIYQALRAAQQDAEGIFDLDREAFARLFPGLGPRMYERLHAQDSERAERDYARLLDAGVRVIHLGHPAYPGLITERMQDGAPPLLFCRGLLGLLAVPGVAVVGSRHASRESLAIAEETGRQLALSAMNVVSGYADGIDSRAHLGALKCEGTTTMVLSSGILEFSRKRTFEGVDWETSVLVVSQFQPAERWSARNAMTRNRLVCALSQAVVVVESDVHREGKMSGTFDAGLRALAMGVPLFVLRPDPPQGVPAGNAELICRGGIAVSPGEVIERILQHREVRCSPEPVGDAHQLPLL
jgi:DNA processing protein